MNKAVRQKMTGVTGRLEKIPTFFFCQICAFYSLFYVLLTMHLNISLDSDQLYAHLLYFSIHQYNTTILDMFRALHMLILRRF